jgi:hypothetical protein
MGTSMAKLGLGVNDEAHMMRILYPKLIRDLLFDLAETSNKTPLLSQGRFFIR